MSFLISKSSSHLERECDPVGRGAGGRHARLDGGSSG